MSFGEGASVPDWVPVYPGVKPKATVSFSGSGQGEGGEAGNFTFTTPDPVSDVTAFYDRKFDEMGFNEGRVKTSTNHNAKLRAKDAEREINVTATKVLGDTHVNVTYARKR
jgi:hypothetical protein